MSEKIELMDKKRRKLLTVNLVFIFVYLIVMMWEFMAVGNKTELAVVDYQDLASSLDELRSSLDQSPMKEPSGNLEKYKLRPLPESNLKPDMNNEEIRKLHDEYGLYIQQSQDLMKKVNMQSRALIPEVEPPHFFWIIVLLFQTPLSIMLYQAGKKIKSDPTLDSALNNELVQFNRLKAWRVAFFASVVSLYALAFIPQSNLSIGWIATVATCVGFAGYIVTFLRLDREEL